MSQDIASPSSEGGAALSDAAESHGTGTRHPKVAETLATVMASAHPFYDALVQAGRPMMAEEMAVKAGKHRGSTGRIRDLWEAGLIERLDTRATMPSGRKAFLYVVVPPERIDKAAKAAKRQPKRRKSLLDLPPEFRAHVIKVLIPDAKVQEALLNDRKDRTEGAVAARAEVRAHQREMRLLQDELERAMREGSPLKLFYRAKIATTTAVDSLRDMRRQLKKEVANRDHGLSAIGDPEWAELRGDVRKYRALADELDNTITKMLGDGDDGSDGDEKVMDVEGWDIDEYIDEFGIDDADVVGELPSG